MDQRVREVAPVLHVTEHSDQAVHGVMTQSTGHACTLHLFVSAEWGQALPPCAGMRATLRVRALLPPPHVVVQPVHVPQSDTLQSTGQALLLHVCVSCSHVCHASCASSSMLG